MWYKKFICRKSSMKHGRCSKWSMCEPITCEKIPRKVRWVTKSKGRRTLHVIEWWDEQGPSLLISTSSPRWLLLGDADDGMRINHKNSQTCLTRIELPCREVDQRTSLWLNPYQSWSRAPTAYTGDFRYCFKSIDSPKIGPDTLNRKAWQWEIFPLVFHYALLFSCAHATAHAQIRHRTGELYLLSTRTKR